MGVEKSLKAFFVSAPLIFEEILIGVSVSALWTSFFLGGGCKKFIFLEGVNNGGADMKWNDPLDIVRGWELGVSKLC